MKLICDVCKVIYGRCLLAKGFIKMALRTLELVKVEKYAIF